MSRSGLAGAALLIAALVAACGGDGAPGTPTATPATDAPASMGSDEPAERDLIDLARRYRGVVGAPRAADLPEPSIGDVQEFHLLSLSGDGDDVPTRRVGQAALRAVSEHAYYFVEVGADVPDADVDSAVSTFEEEVWPAVTGVFGPPPTPGVDGDPRIAIVHADLGQGVGGYVNGEDAYVREVAPNSNQREAVYLNTMPTLGSDAYAHVLAHELQHVIHQRLDLGEESWVNEGLSEVAGSLVAPQPRVYRTFLDHPDTQLNAWAQIGLSGAHYGASGLFMTYLMEQTGGDAGALAAQPADGIEGVRAFLRDVGEPRSLEELVADWAVANELDAPDGPYAYQAREVGPPAAEAVDAFGPASGEVRQFAADYLQFEAADFDEPPAIAFDGAETVPVLGGQPAADAAFWYSGRGDNIDSTLTRAVDLRDASTATLTFRTWYDIEEWWDYGYVAASTDGGATWTALEGELTTSDDPLEVSYGPGYTGSSDGWVAERIDLTPYAGSELLLRFELVTDDSTGGAGWAVDDIAIEEAGFFDDAASDPGGWERQGFGVVDAALEQRFELRLITKGDAPAVSEIELDAANDARIELSSLGSEYEEAVLVVVGATEGTTEPGRYSYEVTAGGESQARVASEGRSFTPAGRAW